MGPIWAISTKWAHVPIWARYGPFLWMGAGPIWARYGLSFASSLYTIFCLSGSKRFTIASFGYARLVVYGCLDFDSERQPQKLKISRQELIAAVKYFPFKR
jgi:hypothetical protein